MDNSFELRFKTAGNAVVTGAIESVKSNNINEIATVSDIFANQKINVAGTFVNSSDESKTATFVIAYYKGNELANIDIYQSPAIAAKSKAAISAEFTAPSDLTGIDGVSIFLWDNFSNIMPYAPAKVIGSN